MEREIAVAQRVIVRNNAFVALLPYASTCLYETRLLLLQHEAFFMITSGDQLHGFVEILKKVLLKLHTGLNNPAFNLTLDDVPCGDE